MKVLALCVAAVAGVSAGSAKTSNFLQMKATTKRTAWNGDAWEEYDNVAEDPDGMTIEEAARQGSELDGSGNFELDMVTNDLADAPHPTAYPDEDLALEDANDEENDFAPSHIKAHVIKSIRYNNRDMIPGARR